MIIGIPNRPVTCRLVYCHRGPNIITALGQIKTSRLNAFSAVKLLPVIGSVHSVPPNIVTLFDFVYNLNDIKKTG